MRTLLFTSLTLFSFLTPLQTAYAAPDKLIERGRYLVTIAGCNDCHTPAFAPRGGKVPEKEWLTGDGIGWRGPWGTTYSSNLRLLVNALKEKEWITLAKSLQSRPPMPSYALNAMTEEDLKAIYRFINSLGPSGVTAPAYVPPTEEPKTPYFDLTPKEPKK